QLADFGHGLRADTITGQKEKRTNCHRNPPWAARRKTSRRVFDGGEHGVKLVPSCICKVLLQPDGIGGFLSLPQGLFKQSNSRSGTVLYGIGFLVFYLDAFS